MSYEKSNKQSDVVPHGFIHCTEGSQGLDLETLLLSVKDHWPFDGWTQLCACLVLVKMNASGVWRPHWEASPVQRGAGQGGHWMVTSRPSLALSLMAPSFWSQSQGWERLVMLPLFLGVLICRGGLNEHYLTVSELDQGPGFPGLHSTPSLPKHMHTSGVKKCTVWVPLLKQWTCWEDSEWARLGQAGTRLPGTWLRRQILDVLASPPRLPIAHIGCKGTLTQGKVCWNRKINQKIGKG